MRKLRGDAVPPFPADGDGLEVGFYSDPEFTTLITSCTNVSGGVVANTLSCDATLTVSTMVYVKVSSTDATANTSYYLTVSAVP